MKEDTILYLGFLVALVFGFIAGYNAEIPATVPADESNRRTCTGAVYVDCYRASGEHAECREHAREICQ